jgi:hypothetical protein
MASLQLVLVALLACLSAVVAQPSLPIRAAPSVVNYTVVLPFTFSQRLDSLSCLSADASAAVSFAASWGGDIFTWSFKSPPASVSPSYSAGDIQKTAFGSCQANPQGAVLYLIDVRGLNLYAWTVATPTVAPKVVATFPNEKVGTLTSVVVDFANSVAYVGTRFTDVIYSVNLTTGAASAFAVNDDVTALALSKDGFTLYYGAPAMHATDLGAVNALAVKAGYISDPTDPSLVYSSPDLVFPNSVIVAGSVFYVSDGGAMQGLGTGFTQTVTAITSSSTPTPAATGSILFSTTTINLPGGLLVSNNGSLLYFISTATLDALPITKQAQAAPVSSTASPSQPVTSAAGSSAQVITALLPPLMAGTSSPTLEAGESSGSAPAGLGTESAASKSMIGYSSFVGSFLACVLAVFLFAC